MINRAEVGEEKGKKGLQHAFSLMWGLFLGYVVTLLGLFILALLLLKFRLSENTVKVGIIAIYLLSVFLAGFFLGKIKKTKRFLWGMAEGTAYYLVLLILSLWVQKGLGAGPGEVVTTFFLCAAGGTLGGMLS
ncbi:MAG: TIGR04086 family membrane protein [Lachnospiraceae bacterium]|nr:TIGR04086 family membrane protein [Lachnospiraceae bacterium]